MNDAAPGGEKTGRTEGNGRIDEGSLTDRGAHRTRYFSDASKKGVRSSSRLQTFQFFHKCVPVSNAYINRSIDRRSHFSNISSVREPLRPRCVYELRPRSHLRLPLFSVVAPVCLLCFRHTPASLTVYLLLFIVDQISCTDGSTKTNLRNHTQ